MPTAEQERAIETIAANISQLDSGERDSFNKLKQFLEDGNELNRFQSSTLMTLLHKAGGPLA